MTENKKFTIQLCNTEGLNDKQIEFIEKLNCSTNYECKDPEGSIMHYGQLCDHDDGYLCEHRLQVIINYVRDGR